jgi:HSP20 family molecular chaperone IbpA
MRHVDLDGAKALQPGPGALSWPARDRKHVDDRPLNSMRASLNRFFNDLGDIRTDWGEEPEPGADLPPFGIKPIMEEVWDPDVAIYRKGDVVVVRAELPGLDREHVHVDVGTGELTISGEFETPTLEDGEDHHRSERNHGTFFRAIPLVEGADAEHCAAHFRDGVLEVEFQLPHDPKPKRKSIAID